MQTEELDLSDWFASDEPIGEPEPTYNGSRRCDCCGKFVPIGKACPRCDDFEEPRYY